MGNAPLNIHITNSGSFPKTDLLNREVVKWATAMAVIAFINK